MKPGTTLVTQGQTMTVVRRLGGGSEGEVFEIANAAGDHRLALKWYHADQATRARRHQLTTLIQHGKPNDRFLWPLGLIDDPATGRFGYVMRLRPDGFVGLAALLRGRVPRKERAVVRFAFELALAFRDLHISGLCYRDINFGNAFMDPNTGAALVCDNDNVGIHRVGVSNVRGTPKFWAPEVARDVVPPSKYTDRYSMAVMLFFLLLVHHPLEGLRTEVGLADDEANRRHYVDDPLFCFDPDDPSNRPDPAAHAHVTPMWNALPERIRSLFVRSFTQGITHPARRVVDSEWCEALAEMRSGLYHCSTCQQACFLDRGGRVRHCASCGAIDDILTLRVNNRHIAVAEGAVVAEHHLRGDLNFDVILGTVEAHPSQRNLYGLRIDIGSADYSIGSGSVRSVSFGERAGLLDSAQLRLDGTAVSVQAAERAVTAF